MPRSATPPPVGMSSTALPAGSSPIASIAPYRRLVSVPNATRPATRARLSRSTKKSYTADHGWPAAQAAEGLAIRCLRGARLRQRPHDRLVEPLAVAALGDLDVRARRELRVLLGAVRHEE